MNSAKVLADILAHKKMIERLAVELRKQLPKWIPIFPGDPMPPPDRAALELQKLIAEAEALAKEPPF